MDRHEVPIDDRLRDLVEIVRQRGEVAIVDNGEVAALVSAPAVPVPSVETRRSISESLKQLEEDTRHLPKMTIAAAAALIRGMRDQGY